MQSELQIILAELKKKHDKLPGKKLLALALSELNKKKPEKKSKAKNKKKSNRTNKENSDDQNN